MTSLMTSCDLPTAPLRGAILLVHSYPILRAGWDQGGTDYQSLSLGPLISLKGDMGELQATRNITLKQTRERWLIRRRVTGYNQDNYYQHFLLSNNAEIFLTKISDQENEMELFAFQNLMEELPNWKLSPRSRNFDPHNLLFYNLVMVCTVS